ncbi:hypothetical protein MCEZEM1_01146 [Comamonadaceae bacterium]
MLLTDIAVEHTIAPPKVGLSVNVVLHPFTNTQRDSLGKFEIVRTVREPSGKDVKRSTFVSSAQLAELYAKGVLDEYGFSIRMCVPGGKYPKTTPTKKLLPAHIKPGSPFDLAVQAVDVAKEATRELRTALFRTGVTV